VRRSRRSLAAVGTLIVAVSVLAAGAESRTSALPPPVTLQGVGGVEYGATLERARKRWGPFAIAIDHAGSSLEGYAAICAGRMRGRAFFRAPDGAQTLFLNSVTFVRGARTDKNVGIGSSLKALRAAYGSRLVPDPKLDPGYSYLVFGSSVVSHKQPAALAFGFDVNKKRVEHLSYGVKGEVGGNDFLMRVDC
jgi:hypothetical protein